MSPEGLVGFAVGGLAGVVLASLLLVGFAGVKHQSAFTAPVFQHAHGSVTLDDTRCYWWKEPEQGPYIFLCKDGRYGVHRGDFFTPKLHGADEQ